MAEAIGGGTILKRVQNKKGQLLLFADLFLQDSVMFDYANIQKII